MLKDAPEKYHHIVISSLWYLILKSNLEITLKKYNRIVTESQSQ